MVAPDNSSDNSKTAGSSMPKSRLFHALRLLEKSDRTRFKEFLNSPFFNKKPEIAELFRLLESAWLSGPDPQPISEESVFQKVYPKKPFSSNAFNKLKTHLMNLLLKFFAQLELENEKGREALLLVRKLNALGDGRILPGVLAKTKKELQKPENHDADVFFRQYELESEYNSHLNKLPQGRHATNLSQVSHHLDLAFLVYSLKTMYATANERDIIGEGEETPLFLHNLNYLRQHSSTLPQLVRMYYLLYLGVVDPEDESHFEQLRTLLRTSTSNISPTELTQVYTGALNYCTRKLNQGRKDYLIRWFELSQEMLEGGLLLQDGTMSPWQFKNIITIALRLEKFEQAKEFIQQYSPQLAPEHRKTAIAYNTGVLHFAMKDFRKAEKHLNLALQSGEDVFYHLDIRGFLLRIYYEMGDATSMESLCHSFRMYVERNKNVSKAHKTYHLALIRFFRRLINTPPMDHDRLRKLRKDVLKEGGNQALTRWMLEKIDGMLGN